MRLLNSDTDTMVDRRIVVKLLTTYFERGQSPDVLQLMTRMLGFSGEFVAYTRVYAVGDHACLLKATESRFVSSFKCSSTCVM